MLLFPERYLVAKHDCVISTCAAVPYLKHVLIDLVLGPKSVMSAASQLQSYGLDLALTSGTYSASMR
jgi:hypothetical protein